MKRPRWRWWHIRIEETGLFLFTPWFSVSLYDRCHDFLTDSLCSGYELLWKARSDRNEGVIPFACRRARFWLTIPYEDLFA